MNYIEVGYYYMKSKSCANIDYKENNHNLELRLSPNIIIYHYCKKIQVLDKCPSG